MSKLNIPDYTEAEFLEFLKKFADLNILRKKIKYAQYSCLRS